VILPSQVAEPGRLGPLTRLVVMENHDAAYQVWLESGLRQRVLIHIDAHHDMWWTPDGAPVTIANFICPALKDDLVREVFWVVPDPSWESTRTRRPILRHLRAILKGYPGPSSSVRVTDREMSAVVLGKPLHVLPLRHLPLIQEPALLDIDVDYLLIPRVSHGETDRHAAVPWCWPEELLSRLAELHIRTDLATIVYSVEGGYTPLKWKYLGDELALRLRQPGADDLGAQAMSLLREASLAAQRGDVKAAETCQQQAKTLLPDSAAPCYHLAQLCLDSGRHDVARALYQEALARDPSYRTPYNSAGIACYGQGRLEDSRREHKRTLALDPNDAYAHLGLGQIAADQKRWADAESFLRAALALDDCLPDAWRQLGRVLTKQKRYHEAISAYQRGLKLVLHGRKPLTDYIITQPPSGLVIDPHHCKTHVELAQLYEATGAIGPAINGYRIGIAGGQDGVLVRLRLARLYLRQRQWRQTAGQTWQAVKASPMAGWQAYRRMLRHVRRSARRLSESR
jgi:tetratricopeptide (TPR) repeat protein